MSEPVGPLERDIVIACLASDDPAPYNVPVFLRFDEPVDCDRLARAATAVLGQAEPLRRGYVRHGRDIRRHYPAAAQVERVRCRAADLPRIARERRIRVLDTPLIRLAVLELLDDPRVRLFVNVHHVLMDGLSLTIFLNAVVEAYLSGRPPVLECDDGQGAATRQPATRQPAAGPAIGPPGVLPTVPLTDDLVAAFLRNFDRLRRPGPEVVHRRGVVLPDTALSFAANLAAFVPALAAWVGSGRVVCSVALLGRPISRLRALGNFVRLQPLAFDVDRWRNVTHTDLVRSMTALGGSLLMLSGSGGVAAAVGRSRLAEVLVVFDYKTASLVPERIHPDLAAFLEEDPTYSDSKYEIHFSIFKTSCAQTLTVSARNIPEPAVFELADAYERRLRASCALPAIPTAQPPEMETITCVRP